MFVGLGTGDLVVGRDSGVVVVVAVVDDDLGAVVVENDVDDSGKAVASLSVE